MSAVHAGDELMGFTAAVFALGTRDGDRRGRAVPDEATRGLMLSWTQRRAPGTQPAHALVEARAGDES